MPRECEWMASQQRHKFLPQKVGVGQACPIPSSHNELPRCRKQTPQLCQTLSSDSPNQRSMRAVPVVRYRFGSVKQASKQAISKQGNKQAVKWFKQRTGEEVCWFADACSRAASVIHPRCERASLVSPFCST
ncbi:hypothetical protein IE81DRAFT_42727 [Ceraceosorus guamensis]|uniref:Uncharacterized protein n=1 Tax=Ceraceosorus guamensis TaxID=1522189 RepID=A0A316VNR3_9BASI|nr:hypothetical protein IE81DRAFT_42727 [Ceraceosorus guamensis]PWN39172.1 hypothetical protein IE81DRAFT_42727 [Ceraceosorus guamensis]